MNNKQKMILVLAVLSAVSVLGITGYVQLILGFIIMPTTPISTTYNSTEISFEFETSMPSSWCAYSLNNNANITVTNKITLTASPGINTLAIYCNNSVGNVTLYFVTFNVTIPTVVPPSAPAGAGRLTSGSGLQPPVKFVNYTLQNEKLYVNLFVGLIAPVYNPQVNVTVGDCTYLGLNLQNLVEYACLNISLNIDENNITEGILHLHVPISWVEQEDINISTIRLLRIEDAGTVEEIAASMILNKTTFVCVEANISEFSTFAIVGEKNVHVCGNNVCEASENSDSCCVDCGCSGDLVCKFDKCIINEPIYIIQAFGLQNQAIITWIIVLVGIAIVMEIIKRRMHRKHRD